MSQGVTITSGLKDWQIVQQTEGRADFQIEGTFEIPELEEAQETQETQETEEQRAQREANMEIFARVVEENTGAMVLFWQKAVITNGENRTWTCTLQNVPVGGLYRIETCIKEGIQTNYEWAVRGDMVHHVGVGDVFVIAGQSNSAGYGKDMIYDPIELGVHVYKNSDQWEIATHPLNDATRTCHPINEEGGNAGHSPYLAFGKYLKRTLGYPIGLIQTALGGSPLERWNPEEIGDLYENMIARVNSQGGRVKGILWYQGCSDTTEGHEKTYEMRFQTFVEAMRRDLEDAHLPIFTFQINRVLGEASKELNDGWSIIREAQRRSACTIEGVYLIPTMDGVLSDCIHNSASSNIVLGERLARQALEEIYGYKMFGQAPNIKSIEGEENRICMEFAPVYNYLYAYELEVSGLPFTIVDGNGENPIASYEMKNSATIQLNLSRKIEGTCVVHNHYGANPKGHVIVDFATHYPIVAFSKEVKL